jgi:hypothetical protein
MKEEPMRQNVKLKPAPDPAQADPIEARLVALEKRGAAVERAMAETQLFLGDLSRDLQKFAFLTFESANRLEGFVEDLLPKEVVDAAFAEWQKRTGNEDDDDPAEA